MTNKIIRKELFIKQGSVQ